MKKIYTLLFIALILSSCSNKNIDTTSSATGVWDPEESGLTEADVQFGNLRQENSLAENETTIIKNVRPEVSRFITNQFLDENSEMRELKGLKYRLNNKARSTIFRKNAKHVFAQVGYDYTIELELLDNYVENEEYIKNILNQESKFKEVDMNGIGKVLVKNNENNSYSAILKTNINKDDNTYSLNISSNLMSIPEILMLTEEFTKYIE